MAKITQNERSFITDLTSTAVFSFLNMNVYRVVV